MSKKKKSDNDKVQLYFIGNNSVGVTGSCIFGMFKDENFLIELGGVQDGTSLENYRANKSLLDKIDFSKLNYIFVNHFHQDHSMLVLSAVKRGFKGKIIMNHQTAMISKVLWEDTCHIMEHDITYFKQSKGLSLEPLYKNEDVERTMDYICEYEENVIHKLSCDISFRLLRNNHVCGSTSLELFCKDDNSKIHKLYYSSDMGSGLVDKYFVFDKIDKSINSNLTILESTYNSIERKAITKKARKEELKILEDTIIDTIINNNANITMPCFSADRSQNILVHIKNIFDKHEELKDTIVYLDGKLTSKVMKVYDDILEGEQKELFEEILNWKNLKIISDYMTGTRMILADQNPHITISSSGMGDKGHVLEHIKASVKSKNDTIIFTGYSSPSSLASRLKEKLINPSKKNILIEKMNFPFHCNIVELSTFSSHIQRQELINLMKEVNTEKIILVHGEIVGRRQLAKDAMEELMKVNKTTRIVSAERNMKVEF